MTEMAAQFAWAERLDPQLLKSKWWVGHIPFAYEIVGRQRPRILVELGTYSGTSFAAFCQAAEASGAATRCYGVDRWAGDIHMGKFNRAVYRDVRAYVSSKYPSIATLVRKDFAAAVRDFADGSVDLLHIDGTHTFEAVANDFHIWLPKMSERGVVLFHDVNVTMENHGPASLDFGVRRFFDSVKHRYPHLEFDHCWGLGVLVVGAKPDAPVLELVELSRSPEFKTYFAAKGEAVSRRFADMNVPEPVHRPYGLSLWQRAMLKAQGALRRLRRSGSA